ncbi:MAG: M91 family zinc metallopeptidase [Acidobacteriota bacterium]
MKLKLLLFGLALTIALPAGGDVIISGTSEFVGKVEDCWQQIMDEGGDGAQTLNDLQSSSNDHVIRERPGKNGTSYNSGVDATVPEAGGSGKGTGTTVKWDPNLTTPFSDWVNRDPCACLLHELNHSRQGDTGTRDDRPGHNGIPKHEIDAVSNENKYRKDKGLPQRTKYKGKELPSSAIH